MTINILQSATRSRGGLYSYRELSSKTGLPVSVLSRYAKGHVLPTSKRARQLWKALKKLVSLEAELKRRIEFNDEGYFDNTNIIGNLNILRQSADHALVRFAGKRITKIMTAATDGVPLATLVANALGVNLVIAKGNKEIGVPKFLEETYTLGTTGVLSTLYLPKNALKKGDSVLIIDDMIKSGETPAALVNLVRKAKAEISGIFFLISVGNEWRKKIDLPKETMIEVVVKV
jgi:adenine/guanine phosphoribosyltransferase-like PRPP-binding protein